MPTEAPAYTVLVTVDGEQLPADVASLLASGYVDNSLNVPDLFLLRFSDDHGIVVQKGRFAIGAVVKLSVQPTANAAPKELLTGEITALESEIDSAGKHLVVRGFDKSHRLFRGKRVAAYVNVKATDIVRHLAQQAGLTVGEMTTKGPVLEHVCQPGLSDWEFLTVLARDLGAEVAVVNGGLNFRDPQDAGSAPSGSSNPDTDAKVIQFGKNLVALRATVTAADQVPTVEVRGWDPQQKAAVVGTASAITRSAVLADAKPDRLAQTFASPKWIEANSRMSQQAQCQARAEAVAERLSGSFAELDGMALGNPELKAGTPIALAGIGDPFDGKYTLSSTRHEFSPETGYQTAFCVSNLSDRSFYGAATGGGGPAAAATPWINGVVPAIVTDARDPEDLGRAKVKIPVLADDFETGWCRVVQLGAGDRRGVVWLPEVGDEVLVAFGMGEIDEPYVLGGIFNGHDKPDQGWSEHIDQSAGAISRRALVSRTGLVMEMIETAQDEKLTLSTNGGEHRLTLSQKDKAIEIISKGPLSVTAEQDAQVTSTSGNISMSGTKISIAARSDLELTGVNVKIAASAAAQMTGATATVKGDASAELSGGATTTISAPIVKIN